jgi:co-chaperonin GroES (HSP10)
MKNKSGIHPVEYKILVLPDKIDDKSSGGLFLAASAVEKEQHAQERGILVEVGGNAFEGWDATENRTIPRVDDKIIYPKYSGIMVHGKDENEYGKPVIYRIMNDKDIVAIVK